MLNFLYKQKFILLVIISYCLINLTFASDYGEIIKKNFSNKKLESIEGIWTKTYANEGPTGCVTMFYKDKNDFYYQEHIDSCFVTGKITGKQKKVSENKYEGENAVYFFNGDVNWGPSSIKISDNLKVITITHSSHSNFFTERWERVWPKDITSYNESLNN